MDSFKVKADVTYKVSINKVIDWEEGRLLPRDKHRIRGDTLSRIVAQEGWEVIDGAVPLS